MADETNAPAAPDAADSAAPNADALTDVAQPAEGKARGADGKFAPKAPADAIDAPEWRKALGKGGERFTSEVELAKSYAEAEKRLSKAIVPPDEKAPDDVKAAYRAKLLKAAGVEVPESVEAYGLSLGDDADPKATANLTDFLGIAHKAGISKTQAEAVLQWFVDRAGAETSATSDQLQRSMAEAEIALRREWHNPGEFDLNHAIAKDAVRTYGDSEFRDISEMKLATLALAYPDKSLNELPAFARTWANVGRKTGSAQPVISGSPAGQKTMRDLTEMYVSDRYQKGNDPEFMKQVDDAMRRYLPADEAA